MKIAVAALACLALPLSTAAATAPPADAAAASTAQVNDCWSTDNGRPVVDVVSSSPAAVDTGSGPVQVLLSVQVHDTGGPGPASGVGRVTATLIAEDAGYRGGVEGYFLESTLSEAADGTWRARVTVPAHTTATYDVFVTATDRSDVGTRSDAQTTTPPGDQPTQQGVLTTTDSNPDPYPDDTARPEVTALSFSSTRVDTRRHAQQITLRATATDDRSGVDRIVVDFLGGSPRYRVGAGPGRVTLHRVPGTDGFRATATFTRWLGTHDERVHMRVFDRAGRDRNYRNKELPAGFPRRVHVVSGPLNAQGPRVVKVLRGARSVDVRRHDQFYPVRLLLADPQGVRRAWAGITSGSGRLHRVSGTSRRGVWVGHLPVSHCAAGSGARLRVTGTDGQGLVAARHTTRFVRLRATDHVAPLVTNEPDSWGADPSTFRLSEPVRGISTENVAVHDYEDRTIAGSWSCRGPQDQEIDCLGGPVLEATFTPDPGAPGMLAWVDWAPEHHLDVLDRHGNPMGASYRPDYRG